MLVRHGQSTWNVERRFQGQLDPPLTDLGREQARRLASRLATRPLVAIYTSDLSRARQTAQPLARCLGLPLLLEPGLKEVALGEWEGRTREEVMATHPELWQAWLQEPDWDLVPGSEGSGPFEARVRATVEAIFTRHPRQEVVCFTHGGVIQVALAAAIGSRPHAIYPFVIENCSLTVLRRVGSRTLVGPIDDTCHLDGELSS